MGEFSVTFFGVSGSSAASNPNRKKYGNNTACALVIAGNHVIILDMGTGIVPLADYICKYNIKSAHVLLSHFHYDHIEGFPYFTPVYNDLKLTIHGEIRENPYKPGVFCGIKELFRDFLRKPFFPVIPEALNENITYHDLKPEESFVLESSENTNQVLIETMQTNHTDFSTAYKISFDGKTLVYLIDHEHFNEPMTEEERCKSQKIEDFCRNADVVIYDAHFTKEEYETGEYEGWGHSTHERGIEFAKSANIRNIVLSHHAIWRTDEKLDAIEKEVQKKVKGAYIAKEGLMLKL